MRPSCAILGERNASAMGTFLTLLVNFLYPPRCAACAVRLTAATPARLCAYCQEHIERAAGAQCSRCGDVLRSATLAGGATLCPRCVNNPPSFRAVYAATIYHSLDAGSDNPVASLIRRHKYGLDQSLSRALAECLPDPLPLRREAYDLIVPVPLHRKRLRWRGFNQSALLGTELARRLRLPLAVGCLRRVRATPPQTAQTHAARLKNVAGAFALRNPQRISGQRVLLVDDVVTTGATVDECARVLLAAGAAVVDVFALARVL